MINLVILEVVYKAFVVKKGRTHTFITPTACRLDKEIANTAFDMLYSFLKNGIFMNEWKLKEQVVVSTKLLQSHDYTISGE